MRMFFMIGEKCLKSLLAVFMILLGIVAHGEAVYQITGNVTGGIDLLGMEGVSPQVLKGASTTVSVSGEITHSEVSDDNPFRLIGAGGNVRFAADTKLLGTPLSLEAEKGLSTWSKWQFTGLRSVSPSTNIFVGPLNTLLIEDTYHLNVVGDYAKGIEYQFLLKGQLFGWADLYVGRNAGNAVMTIDGGIVYISQDKDFYLGRCDTPVRTDIAAKAFMTNATVTCGNFYLMYGCKQSNTGSLGNESVLLDVGHGTTVSLRKFHMRAGNFARIRYSGGRSIFSEDNYNVFHIQGYDADGGYPNPVLTVVAADGNPIDIEIPSDRNLSGGYAGPQRKLHMTGDGGFVKRGNGVLTWTTLDNSPDSVCDYTGPTIVKGGGIKLVDALYAPGRGRLDVEAGAFFDMNGIDAAFTGMAGDGNVRNTSEMPSVMSLGYGDCDSNFDIAVSGDVAVTKVGKGTLTICERAADFTGDLTINEGMAVVATGVSLSALRTVTIEKGAVLDIRGATFKCNKLIKRGVLLTDGATVFKVERDTDSTFGGFAMPGRFVKDGNGSFTIHADGSVDSDIEVEEGRLVCRPLSYRGKYFKVNVFKTIETDNIWHLYVAEFSLIDTAGNRINAHEWTYRARPGEGDLGSFGGIPDASGLAEWEVALAIGDTGYHYYNYPEGSGPDKAMDGDASTVYDQTYWWSGNAFMFRLPDSTADVAGFQFTTPSWAHDSLPAQWKIYGSEDGRNWTLIADNSVDWDDETARADALAAVPRVRNTDYNNGVPFVFNKMDWTSGTPFGNGTISVKEGAILDFSNMAMEISRLSLSASIPSGTISRFTPAIDGELILDEIPDGLRAADCPLPITIGEIGSSENLKTWRVSVDGVAAEGVGVRFRNGQLFLTKRRGLRFQVR